MPSTFVHGLLPTSCVIVAHTFLPKLSRKAFWKLIFLCMILGNLPDLDVIPAALMPEHWTEIHREWGHNFMALTLWIWLGTGLLHRVSSEFKGVSAWSLSGSLVLSHVFLDAMTDFGSSGQRGGVPLLFPFSDWQFRLPFLVFKPFYVKRTDYPLWDHVTSTDFWQYAVFYEMIACFSILLIWFLAIRTYQWLRTPNLGTMRMDAHPKEEPSPHRINESHSTL